MTTVFAIAPVPEAVLIYTISGGADESLFSIDSSTGQLTFRIAPNYQFPSDVNTDNLYEVQVSVSDGILSYVQDFIVTIVDTFDLKLSVGVKRLNFSWMAYEGAVSYKLFESNDPSCKFSDTPYTEIYFGNELRYSRDVSIHKIVGPSCYFLQAFGENQNVVDTSTKSIFQTIDETLDIIGNDYINNYLLGGVSLRDSPLSISEKGDIFIVGRPSFFSYTGIVYVYKRSQKGNWILQRSLGADDIATVKIGDKFGASVALSGDGKTLAIGAPGTDATATRTDAGVIYIFRWDSTAGLDGAGDWVRQFKIPELNSIAVTDNSLGFAVNLSQNGSILVANANTGAYVFRYVSNPSGSDWRQITNLLDLIQQELLNKGIYRGATSISDDGTTVTVGVPSRVNRQGAVFIFRNTGNDLWDLDAKKTPNSTIPTTSGVEIFSRFGEILSISGDGNVLVVGDYSVETYGINDVGMVYVYRRSALGAWDIWSEIQIPYPLDGERLSYLNFGRCVDVSYDGTLLTIGAPGGTDVGPVGSSWIFRWDSNVTSNKNKLGDWTKFNLMSPNFLPEQDNHDFGCNTILSGDGSTLLVEILRLNSDWTKLNADLYIF